jgi:hypothetical protein
MRHRTLALALALVLTAWLPGCSDDESSSFAVTFTPSNTALAPRVIKLVQKSKSGGRVVVSVVVGGPDTTLDMYSFAFDVKIGDPNVLRFATGSDVPGGALVPFAGQTVDSIVGLGTLPGGGADPSTVVVGVSKLGGGLGNGVSAASAVIVDLAFDVRSGGTTTLAITGSGGNPPRVFDSGGSAIGTMTFDAATASVVGTVTGGGGGY